MNRQDLDSKENPGGIKKAWEVENQHHSPEEVIPERPITGCCSSLSVPSGGDSEWEDSQSACFDDSKNYNCAQPTPHASVSREELLKRMDEYHGLCLADDNIDSFVENQNTVISAIEQLMTYSAEHNDQASLL